MVKIALIGDVHRQISSADVTAFNQSDYDLLLFVGDLANYRHREGLAAARILAGLRKPALLIPGNHDGILAWQLLAEIKQSPFWIRLFSRGQARRVAQLRRALGPVAVGGYSAHAYQFNGFAFDVIAARPFAMGGSSFSFAPYLQRAYGVADLAASAARLRHCVDAAHSDTLIFLAHNGPTGLGAAADAIWGADFRRAAGDHGDADLAEAVAYAQAQGRRVVAVVAGHMHWRTKQGAQRQWHALCDGIHYVNAARVPRIWQADGQTRRHHLRLTFGEGETAVAPIIWPL